GPSCSGKTTLGRALTRILPNCRILNQDDYYKPDSEIPVDPETGLDNWDTPAAVDFDQFIAAIDAARAINASTDQPPTWGTAQSYIPTPPIERPQQGAAVDDGAVDERVLFELRDALHSSYQAERFIVVDGFLLFADPRVAEHLDVRVFVTASKTTLQRRRDARVGYTTVEGFWQDPPGYFDKIVWPNYVLHHHTLLELIGINGE
ncbi:P-loop containing nucleoside triphosphate hydrolase protein, partial [Thamnocephalis sphaerospora]